MTSDVSHISVGDRVVIKHYTGISFGVKSIGDNNEYEFCVVVSIELRDHNHGYTN